MMLSFSATTLCYAVEQVYSEINVLLSSQENAKEERSLWRELSCCILSSQVDYQLAREAAYAIDQEGVLLPSVHSWERVADDIYAILDRTFIISGRPRRYRFPVAKASQLAKASETIRKQSETLIDFLEEFDDVGELREWMVRNVPGLGPKQSSMFLRNAGITLDLAVLDRHVLEYMRVIGLLEREKYMPSTLRAYQATETVLRCHANELGYYVGILDWAIWIVMRVAKSKNLTMEIAV